MISTHARALAYGKISKAAKCINSNLLQRYPRSFLRTAGGSLFRTAQLADFKARARAPGGRQNKGKGAVQRRGGAGPRAGALEQGRVRCASDWARQNRSGGARKGTRALCTRARAPEQGGGGTTRPGVGPEAPKRPRDPPCRPDSQHDSQHTVNIQST